MFSAPSLLAMRKVAYRAAVPVGAKRTMNVVLPPPGTVGGVEVGFIGLTLEGTAQIVSAGGIQDVNFLDEASSINAAANLYWEAGLDADEDRLKQELALFATKVDVAEELSRLATHVAEVRRVLAAGGSAGKRLDFLMQELHREANTLGSKSVDAELSQASLEIKVLIEQMREQVQNLE